MAWAHDDVTAGHLGTQKTYGKVRTRYYWCNMFRDIDRWCKMENPFDRDAVDCSGPFTLSNAGNRYVVVFTEYLTRCPEACAVPSTDAPTIARLLVNHIVTTHGAPKTLFRDQKDWDTHLPTILFGYRVSPHEATGDSPFYLLYGREPRYPIDASLLPPSNVKTLSANT
ncbi:Retrovirus-related Pol poly from transposon 412, partial [Paramuricea clavata]